MRILFSTWPAHGHLLPLLPLVRAAQHAGHEVLLASGAEGVAEAARRGVPVVEVGPSRAESDAAFRADPPDLEALPPPERIPAVIRRMFCVAAPRRAAALVPLAERWRPDLVVHPITELAGAIAAERTGARHAVHGLGPLPAPAWSWFGARFGELCAEWDVPALATGILDRPYLDNCPASLQPDAVAAFGHRLPLRPVTEPDGDALPWTAEQLAALPHPQTLHLTLGTLFHGATGVFLTALEGLLRLPVNVLVTVGPGTDPARLGPQPPQVLVADFAPHALLLPRCDGLVTQGGAGTIVAALCHGLPHLILPQGADQFANGAAAERAGVALVIPPAELTADAVEAAARRLLTDPALREAARSVRTEIDAAPAPSAVLATLLA